MTRGTVAVPNDNLLPDFSPDAKMREAEAELRRRKIQYVKCSEHQLKIGPFNFYPNKGTIFKDRDKKALPDRGVEGLWSLLQKLRGKRKDDDDDSSPVISIPPL